MKYTTTIEVQAWQYEGEGVIPEEAKELFELRKTEAWHRVYPYHMHEVIREVVATHGTVVPPEEGTPMDTLFWDDPELGRQKCHAGDWIVCHEYGVEAVSDLYFREEYTAVEP